jgi:Mn-dependent DtxR family transcriptional regulator
MNCLDLFMRLYLLDRAGGLSISELAKSLEISEYFSKKYLKQLIAKKLVRRVANKFYCTPQGDMCASIIYKAFPKTEWLIGSVDKEMAI